MDTINAIPEWFGAALVGAILAATGFTAKALLDEVAQHRARRRERRARLMTLRSLLRASKVAFEIQNEHARTLSQTILSRDQSFSRARGLEQLFAMAYPTFTNEEKELHSIIRSISVNSLLPTNLAMLDWLNNDQYFKGLFGELAQQLAALEAHLLIWKAKYLAWIPDQPEHGLVYLADEQNHGLGFPKKIDDLLDRVLSQR